MMPELHNTAPQIDENADDALTAVSAQGSDDGQGDGVTAQAVADSPTDDELADEGALDAESVDLAPHDDGGADEDADTDTDVEAGAAAQGDPADSAAPADPLRVLEAMLFAAAEPLTVRAMHERMPPNSDVGGLLMALQKEYEGRGVNLIERDGSWAFRTAHDLSDALQTTKDVQRKLSRSAMETLAIVAYHQPVTRAEIENIRGVATHKGTLDVLMEAGWVKPGRRRETPGRPVTWITTTNFLDQFGLESLMDLPGLDELKASGLLDRRPAIDALPTTGDLFSEEDVASYNENEYEEESVYEDMIARKGSSDDDYDTEEEHA